MTTTSNNPVELAAIHDPRFSASGRLDGTRLVVHLEGSADVNARPELGAFFRVVHREALARAITPVLVDMRALAFMNSACLKELLVWLTSLGDTPSDRQYRVHFKLNHDLRWQRRSIEALSCFMQNLVVIEE